MPAETNGRKSFRKMTTEEEAEIRRSRGEISCAECRRLKLKCDKKLPCSSCIRRGCPSICPNGTLTTGHGTRYVLSDTTQLHHKIAEMGQRIRQLEDAVAIFQAGVSNEPHPLLREPLLSIKFGPEVHDLHTSKDRTEPEMSDVATTIDSLGTLTIADGGYAKYFGRSGGSEALFFVDSDSQTLQDSPTLPVDPDIQRLSNFFPLNSSLSWDTEKCLESLYAALPPQPRAWTLCETYWQHGSISYRPVLRDQLIDDILIPVYKLAKEPLGYLKTDIVSPHKLAILFLVFSLGTLLDRTIPPYSPEAEMFLHHGKAALSLRSLFDSPEIFTVQAIAFLSYYHTMGGKDYSLDAAWALNSLACKLGQSMGLHRDPAGWSLHPTLVQRRRFLFWEMYGTDISLSYALGRPPTLRLSYVDCEFPDDDDQTLDESGNLQEGFHAWKRAYTKEIFAPMMEDSLRAKPPSYQVVLDWDRKVREKALPPYLTKTFAPDEEATVYEVMRGGLLKIHKIMTLLHLHRSFFAQAMLDFPLDPLRSPYAPSFLAAYRSASALITRMLNNFARFPDLFTRWWNTWTHLFSAAAIVGVIVSRFPSSSMAPKAFVELGLALDLFRKHSADSPRARSGLVLLARMRDKAFESYSQYSMGNVPKTLSPHDDDLAIFGGRTRVLVSRRLTQLTTSRRSNSLDSPDSDQSKDSSPPTDHATTSNSSSQSSHIINSSGSSFFSTNTPSPVSSGSFGFSDAQLNSSADFFGDPELSTEDMIFAQNWPMAFDNPSIPPAERGNANIAPPGIVDLSCFLEHPPVYEAGTVDVQAMPPDAMQMGMSMMEESGMMDNEQWIAFMRQAGLLGENAA